METLKKKYIQVLRRLNKNTLLLAIVITAGLLILTVGLGWYNNKVVLSTTNPIARYTLEPNNPLSFMSNWDGPNYISISKSGYVNKSLASFFPLYPLLILLFNIVIKSPLDSALLVSWLSLVGAIYFYIKILRRIFNVSSNISALKGLAFFVLFPTAIFLVATYTESLFALLSLAAIYFALNKKYLAVGVFSFLGCLTHLDGLFVVILACLILLEEKVEKIKAGLAFLIGFLGLAAYGIFLDIKFKSPLAFIIAQQKSHGWLNLHYSELFQSVNFFNIVFIILLILAIIYWWQRRRSFSYYSILFLLIPLIGNQFGGFNRYMLVAFPVQFMAYDYFKNKNVSYAYLLAFMAIIWTYFTLQYTGGYIGG